MVLLLLFFQKNIKFVIEIELGLNGQDSSLEMIPAFTGYVLLKNFRIFIFISLDIPRGNETGVYMAIDFGGTNLRCLLLKFESGVYNLLFILLLFIIYI
jgi:hexokinase